MEAIYRTLFEGIVLISSTANQKVSSSLWSSIRKAGKLQEDILALLLIKHKFNQWGFQIPIPPEFSPVPQKEARIQGIDKKPPNYNLQQTRQFEVDDEYQRTKYLSNKVLQASGQLRSLLKRIAEEESAFLKLKLRLWEQINKECDTSGNKRKAIDCFHFLLIGNESPQKLTKQHQDQLQFWNWMSSCLHASGDDDSAVEMKAKAASVLSAQGMGNSLPHQEEQLNHITITTTTSSSSTSSSTAREDRADGAHLLFFWLMQAHHSLQLHNSPPLPFDQKTTWDTLQRWRNLQVRDSIELSDPNLESNLELRQIWSQSITNLVFQIPEVRSDDIRILK